MEGYNVGSLFQRGRINVVKSGGFCRIQLIQFCFNHTLSDVYVFQLVWFISHEYLLWVWRVLQVLFSEYGNKTFTESICCVKIILIVFTCSSLRRCALNSGIFVEHHWVILDVVCNFPFQFSLRHLHKFCCPSLEIVILLVILV